MGDNNDFGMSLRLTSLSLKEQALNPLSHRGTFVSLGLFYDRPRATSRGRFDLDLFFNPVSSRYEDGRDSFASDLRLAYSRVRRAATPRQDVRVMAGGAVGLSSQLSYFDNWDDSHFYWLTAYSIGPTGTLEYSGWPRRVVSVEVSLPVLALVSRPPTPILYKVASSDFGWIVGKVHEDMTLTSLHRHLAVNATIRLSRSDASLGRSLFWNVSYLHSNVARSRSLDVLRHSVGASVVF